MIGNVLTLMQTFVDIILLRKGPDALPRKSIIFVIAVGLWLLSSMAAMVWIETYTSSRFFLGTLIGVVGIIVYALLINAAGKAARLLQSLSAIIGCGAILSLAVLFVETALSNVLSQDILNGASTILLLWSVPVEGHIIARAIDRPRFVGIVAAMAVFILQIFLLISLSPAIDQGPARGVERTTSQSV